MKFLSNLLVKAGLVVEGVTDLYAAAAVVDTDKFVVLDGNTIKYRTGSQVLSDIGAEASIPAGTTAQYWRGDKSWQTLNTTVVPEGTNLYFTDARARAAISLTTTGTSGAATYIGGVLNIPQYQAVLTNPVTGTGSAGQVAYWTGTTTQTGSNNLFFNTATGSLGIGTTTTGLFAGTTRSLTLSANGSGEIASLEIQGNRTADQTAGILSFYNGANRIAYITGTVGALTTSGVMVFFTHNAGTANEVMRLTTAGNLHVGTFVSDSGDKLQVSGAARIYSTGVGNSTVIKNNSTDASIFIGGSTMTGSTATRNVIIDPIGSYSALTGGRNYVLGRLGAVLTSASDNVFIGSHGSQLTTGTRNVFIGAHNGDSFSFDPATSRVIFISTGVAGTEGTNKAIPTGNNWAFIGGYANSNTTNQFYFGAAPFINHPFAASLTDISFFAPSGVGTDFAGGDFIFNAGRGTGTGAPGDLIFRTSTATTTGTTLQTLSDRMIIAGGTGLITLSNLAGSGERLVSANASGALVAGVPISISSPSNGQVLKYDGTNWVNSADAGVTGSSATGRVTYWDSASTITGSNSFFWDAANNRLGVGTNTIDAANRLQVEGAYLSVRGTAGGGGGFYTSWPNTSNADARTWGWGSSINVFGDFGISQSNAKEGNPITAGTLRLYISRLGNLLLGSTTDNGLRFQVTGDSSLTGSGNTSATTALSVRNSASTNILTVKNNRTTNIISDAGQLNIASSADATNGLLEFDANSSALQTLFVQLTRGTVGLATSGNQTAVRINGGFSPTSGTGTWHNLHINPVINQTGGANGITRGIYIQPSLTAAADWRSIEWTNSTGWGLYGSGTAANYLAGTLSIGTTANDTGYLRNYATIPVLALQNPTTGTAVGDGFQLSVSGTLAYVWQYENSAILFGTNATERMRLDASGNLGIGVTNPSTQLHVSRAGSVSGRFSNTTSGVNVEIGVVSGLGYVGTQTAASFALYTSDTERARLFTTGNLAVGTTTDAGFRLDVNGTMRVSGASTFNGNMTNAFASLAGGTTVIGGITGVSNGFRIDVDTSNQYQYSFRSGTNTTLFQIASTGAATFSSSVQAGGGTTNASAILQADSTTKGFLPPRMTSAQRAAITSPAIGLVVYQTDGTEGLYIYTNASGWKSLAIVI